MNGDPTIGETIASAFLFLGEAVFNWVPNVVATILNTTQPNPGVSGPMLGPLGGPLSAPEFAGMLERVSAPGVYDRLVEGWTSFVLFSIALCLPFLAVIVYCWIRIFLLRRHEAKMFKAAR